jgi:hypothetical protein
MRSSEREGDEVEGVIGVEFESRTVQVAYERDRLGRAFGELAQGVVPPEAHEHERGVLENDAVVEALAILVTSWDLKDDEGRPVPPTRANLRRLSVTDLYRLLRAISNDAFGE